MSGKGWVTTARGDGLNIDDLIAKSKRPIGVKEENSTIKKRKIPGGNKPLNVRGFQPAQGEAKPQEVESVASIKEKPAPKAAFNDGKEANSQADLTGIKVKKRASTKKSTGTAEEAASEALGDIMTGLEKGSPNAVNAAEQEEKPTRRRSSK